MKNPYRSLLERPLRLLILVTVILLFFVKLYPAYLSLLDRSVAPADSGPLALLACALGLSCLVDLGTIYLLTMGWNDLVGRRWMVFLTPVINICGAVGAWVIYGWDKLAADALHQQWWLVMGPFIILSVILLLQLLASALLFFRLRM